MSFGSFDAYYHNNLEWPLTAVQTKGSPFESSTVQHSAIMYQVKVQNLRHHEVATNLCVDQSTVSRTVALFDDTGDVKRRKYPSNPGTVNLSHND